MATITAPRNAGLEELADLFAGRSLPFNTLTLDYAISNTSPEEQIQIAILLAGCMENPQLALEVKSDVVWVGLYGDIGDVSVAVRMHATEICEHNPHARLLLERWILPPALCRLVKKRGGSVV